jgi:hypothetical protein
VQSARSEPTPAKDQSTSASLDGAVESWTMNRASALLAPATPVLVLAVIVWVAPAVRLEVRPLDIAQHQCQELPVVTGCAPLVSRKSRTG